MSKMKNTNDENTDTLCASMKSTQTEPSSIMTKRKICGMTIKEVVDCCSAFLLPCMLGIFTVVITLYQSNLATQQRLEDQQGAREQREQDLNISRMQRDQDFSIAKAQRDEDALRRLQDFNLTQLQRQDDLLNAQLKRELDEKLEDSQRNLSEKQRAHELMIEANRYDQELGKYRHSLLTVYMNEIEALIIKSNGTISSDARMASIMRGKTLALIRQLDATLKAHLIRFLYETGQLTNGQQPLDVTDAELDGIDLSSTTSDIQSMYGLTLANAYLRNSSFVRRDLTNGNFSGARLGNAQFSESIVSGVDFSGVSLDNASFTNTILFRTSFINSNGNGVKFDGANIVDSNFSQTEFPSSSFVQSSLARVSFIRSHILAANFSMSHLNGTTFMHALMVRSNFDKTQGASVQFTYANLNKSSVQHARLYGSNFFNLMAIESKFAFSEILNSNFSRAYALRSNFSYTTLNHSNFINAKMVGSSFVSATLSWAQLALVDAEYSDFSNVFGYRSNFSHSGLFMTNFTNSILTEADFQRVQGGGIKLSLSQAQQVTFLEAYLSGASFINANVDRAVFINANLRNANLFNSSFNTMQLDQAIAILGAILPSSSNLTVKREKSLMKNGEARCNISISTYWQVQQGEVGLSHHNYTDCYFTPIRANGTVTMTQKIDVRNYTDKVHHPVVDGSADLIMLSARVGGGTNVRLVGKPTDVELRKGDMHVQNGTLQYIWYPKKTKELQVVVEFGWMNQSAWCDDIYLWIKVAEPFISLYD